MALSAKQITCREHGTEYQTWMVDGYVNGKRIRIRCKDEAEALMRKSEKETEAINAERSSRFIQTRLTTAQLNEAEACFDRLAPKYTLTEAVDFFFRHFHQPDFQISISDASTKFRTALEGQVRDRTLVQLKSTLGLFERFTDNCHVHEVTGDAIENFLNSLRARNGTDKASRKTWNNYRGDLHLFFEWCAKKQQRYITSNPAADAKRHNIENGHVDVLSIKKCRDLMEHAAEFKGGKLARYFALALFAGIRPGGELEKLAEHPELIDLDNKVTRITAEISKVGKPRQIKIRPNLRKWLERFPGEIIPVNADRDLKAVRKKFKLTHDVCRHTFISMHIGAFKAFADAAIESGNSESIIRDHYLNTSTLSAAKQFWKIEPDAT
jgi:site-specific recombinase XerD